MPLAREILVWTSSPRALVATNGSRATSSARSERIGWENPACVVWLACRRCRSVRSTRSSAVLVSPAIEGRQVHRNADRLSHRRAREEAADLLPDARPGLQMQGLPQDP